MAKKTGLLTIKSLGQLKRRARLHQIRKDFPLTLHALRWWICALVLWLFGFLVHLLPPTNLGLVGSWMVILMGLVAAIYSLCCISTYTRPEWSNHKKTLDGVDVIQYLTWLMYAAGEQQTKPLRDAINDLHHRLQQVQDQQFQIRDRNLLRSAAYSNQTLYEELQAKVQDLESQEATLKETMERIQKEKDAIDAQVRERVSAVCLQVNRALDAEEAQRLVGTKVSVDVDLSCIEIRPALPAHAQIDDEELRHDALDVATGTDTEQFIRLTEEDSRRAASQKLEAEGRRNR
jgi:hypothetical protein